MRALIEAFPDQLSAAATSMASQPLNQGVPPHENILVLGMGGSGIGGRFLAGLLGDAARVPIASGHDYRIPAWVGPKTVVLACSYSGNTEETLTALDAAIKKGAHIRALTSGGQLAELAKQHGWAVLTVPGGHPPRSQFGWAVTGLLHHFSALGHCPTDSANVLDDVQACAQALRLHRASILDTADRWAEVLNTKSPMLYGDTGLEPVLIRWRQQLNENAKRLCNHHVFPEMNHNELVGWESGNKDLAALFLHTEEDHPRTAERMRLCKEIFAKAGAAVEEAQAIGATRLQRWMHLVHLGDWLSLLMAEKTGVDPVDIRHIDYLKGELAKMA
jgi:glucose/mannose-6-phosphate isomerase